jgi:uncharacterized membrane protein YhaH (DUF805 family)
MDFTQAIASGFANYINFSGRAARSEFWFWVLFTMLVGLAAAVLDHAIAPSVEPFSMLWYLATIVPYLAVTVRRLHDVGRNGWWLLLFFVPLIGFVVLMVWFCSEGTPGYNGFGANPFGFGGHITPHLTGADQARDQAWRHRAPQ